MQFIEQCSEALYWWLLTRGLVLNWFTRLTIADMTCTATLMSLVSSPVGCYIIIINIFYFYGYGLSSCCNMYCDIAVKSACCGVASQSRNSCCWHLGKKISPFFLFFSLSILRLWSCCLFSLATQSAVNKQITVHLSGSHVTTLLYVSK